MPRERKKSKQFSATKKNLEFNQTRSLQRTTLRTKEARVAIFIIFAISSKQANFKVQKTFKSFIWWEKKTLSLYFPSHFEAYEQTNELEVERVQARPRTTPGFKSQVHPGISSRLTKAQWWPWWWSSGQRPRLILRRSEFESCWLLNLYKETKINEKEAWVGQSLKKLKLNSD